MLDANGNRILWGSITETRPDTDLIAAGRDGAMSLPRTLSLSAEGELQTEFAPIVRKLRSTHIGINPEQDPATRQKSKGCPATKARLAFHHCHFNASSHAPALCCSPPREMLQFRRITTQKRFIPQIDGLRFVALASVVFFHIYAALEIGAIPQPIPFNTDPAKRGVELFYGISGFILGVPFASRYLLQAPRLA